jgi:hypothetical protein
VFITVECSSVLFMQCGGGGPRLSFDGGDCGSKKCSPGYGGV